MVRISAIRTDDERRSFQSIRPLHGRLFRIRVRHGRGSDLSAWAALVVAGLLEVVWALCLKYSDGLTRLGPSVAMVVAIAASFGFLGLSLRAVPFGTAYAVWTGIGAAGTVMVGMVAFGESVDLLRLTCLALIVAGVLGLELASNH